MIKKTFKILIPFVTIAIILIFISIVNTLVAEGSHEVNEERYKNELSALVMSGEVGDIDYDYIVKDLDEVDDILKDILSSDIDIKKKSKYYDEAQNVYNNKLNEIRAVLNQKLDDEDFEALELSLDEFYKNLDFASAEIKNTIVSTVDSTYNVNKYIYEEKQRKCRELLEEYKGFLVNRG